MVNDVPALVSVLLYITVPVPFPVPVPIPVPILNSGFLLFLTPKETDLKRILSHGSCFYAERRVIFPLKM